MSQKLRHIIDEGVTLGLASEGRGARRQDTKDEAENYRPFASFTFSATGASVYQLGTFGTARKQLKTLTLTP